MPRKRGGPRTSRNSVRNNSSGPSNSSRGSGAGKTVLAFVLGAAVSAAAGYLYLHSTPPSAPSPEDVASGPFQAQPPAATTQARPLPPSHAAIPAPPFGTSEDVFEAGAHIYASRCASCHGTPLHAAVSSPPAPQLWRDARPALGRQAPGQLYMLTSAGLPSKGMPAYAHVLTETQIWQVTLLLKNADQDLPDPVINILNASKKR